MKKRIYILLSAFFMFSITSCEKESCAYGDFAPPHEEAYHIDSTYIGSDGWDYNSGRCQATTEEGRQCKRSSSSGSIYCWQHK